MTCTLRSPMNILLIEDNPQTARLIQHALTESHDEYAVHTAQTLDQGMGVLSNVNVDVVILDSDFQNSLELEPLVQTQVVPADLPVILVLDGVDNNFFAAPTGLIPITGCILRRQITGARLSRMIQFFFLRAKKLRPLHQNKEKFQTIIEELPDPYYEMDFNGILTHVNKQMCQSYNELAEDLIGVPAKDRLNSDDAERMYNIFLEVFQTGVPKKITNWDAYHQDGTVFAVETSISLIRDINDHPVGFSGISRNATEKVAAQKALQKSEEKYRTILDSIEDGYFEVDLKGRFTFFNPCIAAILERTQQQLLSIDNRVYMDEENAKNIYYAFHRIYKTGEPNRSLQFEIITPHGERRYLESAVSLMNDAAGQATGFRGVVRNIGARKRVELELIQAKERAESATRTKSEFLANMSHEIRTPMNGIIGMFNLLLKTPMSDTQKEFVEIGKRSADTLLVLINDILDFSKIEAGKLEMESTDFNLRATIDDMVLLPATQAQAKGLEFIYHIEHDVPSMLKGDPGRLSQIIMNLALNGVKFTQRGEVALFVTLVQDAGAAVTLRFEVKDTGIGIARADQARLFQSFQQVDGSRARRYGGAGLGLVIARRLTELMGGRIGVESTAGHGSSFWFTAVFQKAHDEFQKGMDAPHALPDKRILIVDDNQTNLNVLAGYLKQWGCSCDQASSAAMALCLLRALAKAGVPYHLVISDMLMPVMDGAQLGQVIKDDPVLQNTLLIMLTSLGLRGDATEMKRIGFSAYLTKPVRPTQLFECLVAVLGHAQDRICKYAPQSRIEGNSKFEFKREPGTVHILLAEDNAINQKLAIHLLVGFGFNVVAVETGREALQALEKKHYDVVLMDLQMPEMDGFEATKRIRGAQATTFDPDVPIIAMTACTDPQDRTACLAAGMDGYIAKPLQPEELLRVVEEKVRGRVQQ